jgi:N-acetylglutamate synthase-like GNAT family acetyltransferase
MTIRKAHEADAPFIAQLINSAYRGESSRAGWTTEADMVGGERINTEGVLNLMREPRSYFLVIEEENEIKATVHLHQEHSGSLYLGMLAVRPTEQSRGFGRELLEAIDREARDLGSREVRLTVIEIRDELIAYYERKGFRLTGNAFAFPYPGDLKIPGLRLLEMVKSTR